MLLSTSILMTCQNKNEGKENSWAKDNLKGTFKSFKEKGKRVLFANALNYYKNYNEKGNITEAIYYEWNDSIRRKEKYKYDERENLIEFRAYDSNEGLKTKYTSKYNEKGNEIERTQYNYEGVLDIKYTYQYDEKGNKIKKIQHNYDGTTEVIELFKYDEKGNRIELISYSLPSGKICSKYDEEGNNIEDVFYDSNNVLVFKQITKYNGKGNVIENNLLYSEGENKNYSADYNYDEKGNWTQQIRYENKVVMFILERTYEYYE